MLWEAECGRLEPGWEAWRLQQGWRRRSRSARGRRRQTERRSARGGRRAAEPGRGEAPRAARGRDPEGDRGRRQGAPSRRQQGRQGRARERRGPVRRARAREDGQDLRRSSPSSATTRHPSYPDRDTNPNIPGPATFNGPLHNAIPAPDRSKDNSTVWQPNYDRAHYQDVYFGEGDGVESLKTYYERQSSGRYSVEGQVTDWVKVQLQRGALRPQRRLPVREQRLQQHVGADQDAINTWVAGQKAAGAHRRPDRRGPRVLRHLGPQRLRRRRQLQRGRRLHRPLPDRPLRRRPGRRRPAPGRGRDLVAPLEGVPEPDRRARVQQGRRHADRHHRPVGGGLHDPAGERRRLGVRARVRPRPRPARPLRHLGRRRQRRQLVDDHGPEPRLGGRGPGHRHPRRRPRRVGQAPARLARLRDRRRPARTARSTSARTSTTAPRRRAWSCRCRRRRS